MELRGPSPDSGPLSLSCTGFMETLGHRLRHEIPLAGKATEALGLRVTITETVTWPESLSSTALRSLLGPPSLSFPASTAPCSICQREHASTASPGPTCTQQAAPVLLTHSECLPFVWKAFPHRWSRGFVDLEATQVLQLPSLDEETGLSPGHGHMLPGVSPERLLALVSSTLIALSKGRELCH